MNIYIDIISFSDVKTYCIYFCPFMYVCICVRDKNRRKRKKKIQQVYTTKLKRGVVHSSEGTNALSDFKANRTFGLILK